MKRKYITNTYLRDIEKYQIKLFLDEEDYYISVKKLISVRKKFIIEDDICVMDNGFYIFEVVPKNKNYAMRLFLDKDKKELEYYFDICKNNGLDEKTHVPFYDDLYLDITYMDGRIKILDEDELINAHNSGDVSDEEFEQRRKVQPPFEPKFKTGWLSRYQKLVQGADKGAILE